MSPALEAPEPEFLNVEETAKLLRLSPRLIREMAKFRRIPCQKFGKRKYRFSRAAILRWMEGRNA